MHNTSKGIVKREIYKYLEINSSYECGICSQEEKNRGMDEGIKIQGMDRGMKIALAGTKRINDRHPRTKR